MDIPAFERSLGSLQNQVSQLTILYHDEVEVHRMTCSLSVQARECAKAWERACNKLTVDLNLAYIQISSAEVKIQQLTTENQRLNLIINHLVPARTMSTQSDPVAKASGRENQDEDSGQGYGEGGEVDAEVL